MAQGPLLLSSELMDRCSRISMEHVVHFDPCLLLLFAFSYCERVLEFSSVVNDQQCLDACIYTRVGWLPSQPVYIDISNVSQLQCVS